MKINWKPAFQYQFFDFAKGAGAFYLIIAALVIFFSLFSSFSGVSTISISGFGVTAAICMFVFGITNPRSDLRLCVQFGISRRTAFLMQTLAILVISVLLAAAGELLNGLAQVITVNRPNLFFADLYQLIYLGADKMTLTFHQHLLSILLNTGIMVVSFIGGTFFTFLFWRLNRAWTILAAILIPVLCCNVIPLTVHRLGVAFPAFTHFGNEMAGWLGASIWSLLLFGVLLSAIGLMVDWLLIRRVNIREPKSR